MNNYMEDYYVDSLYADEPKNKSLRSIELWGVIRGGIWWPYGADCTKEFKIVYTPDEKPFTRKWEGIRQALLDITNDGDFSSCSIYELFGKVEWNEGKYIKSRYISFPICKEIADLLHSEYNSF